MIDTHSHIFDEAFDGDREEVLERAREAGVEKILLPATDSSSHERLFSLAAARPEQCVAMMGLHPTSVNGNPDWRKELELVERYLAEPPAGVRFCAVGEVGLDLYWSRDFLREQTEALEFQSELALKYDLPLVIHTRDAWDEMCAFLEHYRGRGLRGVMHSFSGTLEHYSFIKELGDFVFGIGGPVTYKTSSLAEILPRMDIGDIVLETDSPYLPPVPYRGKRNESSYITFVRDKVAEIYGVERGEADAVTTANARRIFAL